MRLSELVSGSGFSAQHTGAEGDPTISDITFDSRLARPGTLFVALVGEAADGHEYVHRAVAAGAPSGVDLWFQCIVQDATNVNGITLSNCMRGTTP